jgi:hypothetical protein
VDRHQPRADPAADEKPHFRRHRRRCTPPRPDGVNGEFTLLHGSRRCAYANICEHCPNYRSDAAFLPILAAQKTDAQRLAADAQARGWIDEADRHLRLVERLDALIGHTQAS